MARRKTKYHIRKDGLIETTKTFRGIRRHFYGHSDDEVEAKIADTSDSLTPLLCPLYGYWRPLPGHGGRRQNAPYHPTPSQATGRLCAGPWRSSAPPL